MNRSRHTTLFARLMAGGLLTLGAPVTTAAPASAAVTGSGDAESASPASTYGSTAFDATNHRRVRHDRRALRSHACLRKYAVQQAQRMANRQEIWHQDLQRILRDCHMQRVGENVAAGFPSGRTVVVDGWMESRSHRANLLEPRFRLMKVAARKGDDGRWYAAQVFGRR